MAKFSLLGREFDLPRYNIRQMRVAALHIDRINATIGAMTTIEGLAATAGEFCAVLSIGLVQIDASLTPDYLEEMLGFDDLPALRDAFTVVLAASGMASPGEASAPAQEQATGA